MRPAKGTLALAALWVLAFGSVHAESLPMPGAVDPRIRTATYNAEQVYRLYGYVGYAIELVFEDGEQFAGEGGGDLDGITFGWHTNHLILKPKAASVGTNLVIYTDRRAYRFDYSASDKAPDPGTDPVIWAVRFIYPAEPKSQGPTIADQVRTDFAKATQDRRKNLNYWYCGSSEIRPVAASDDGVQTRLTFGAKAELPAVFLSNADGSESLLNFSIEQGDVVIHRVAARLVLRRGKLTGCVVNKSFAGTGDRLSSGTIAPNVERANKGEQP